MPSASCSISNGSFGSGELLGSLFMERFLCGFSRAVLERQHAHLVAKRFALNAREDQRRGKNDEEQADGDDSERGDAAHITNDVLDHNQFLAVLNVSLTLFAAFVTPCVGSGGTPGPITGDVG